MTPTVSIATFIALFAAAMFAAWWDIAPSTRFKWYGQEEGWGLHKDEYGFFSLWKSLRTLSAFVALSLGWFVYCVFWGEPAYGWLCSIPLWPVIVRGLIHGTDNRRHARENREKQRFNLRNGFPDIHWHSFGAERYASLESGGGRYRFRLFGWIHEDVAGDPSEGELIALRERLLARLRKAAEQPESTWFTDDWFAERY